MIGNTNKRPNSLVAKDCNGNTWTVKNPYLRFTLGQIAPVPTGDMAPYILCSDGREIRNIIDPTAIAIDNQCRLMVADNGPDQNIKVFDISGAGTPVVIDTIGVKGGTLGGSEPGIIEPLKFWGCVESEPTQSAIYGLPIVDILRRLAAEPIYVILIPS
ncbi:MAG: hypothetical protein IPF54_20270 [Draconibacterium sp.]|nr:hypothetical protein [Draconibacterium sp.]